MSNVTVQKINGESKPTAPVFAEIAKRLEAVRQRAYEIFRDRVSGAAQELDDWLAAEREIFGWAAAKVNRKDDLFDIQVTLPGFDAKHVEVTASPDEIIVHAAKQDGESSSDIYRRFELAEPVLIDAVKARLEAGILHISAPVEASTRRPKSPTPVKQVNVAAA